VLCVGGVLEDGESVSAAAAALRPVIACLFGT
jgi:hypothetical protein